MDTNKSSSSESLFTPKMVIIAVLILLVILYIYEMQQPAQPVAQPSVPVPPAIPPLTLPPGTQFCQRGWYCDGTPVPDNEATEGKIVCGGNNIRYQCVNNGGTLGWKSLDSCTPGMANMCNGVLTNCTGGYYCNGTMVDKANSEVGSIVCGGGNKQYQCISNGSGVAPSWRIIGDCTSGMLNKCP